MQTLLSANQSTCTIFKLFYKLEFTRICMENHVSMTAKVVFLLQMLLTFGGRYNRYFWDTPTKILRLLNFNMLFQLVLTKFFKSELFSCLPKSSHTKACSNHFFIVFGSSIFPSWSCISFLKSQTFLWLFRRWKCYLIQQLPFSEQGIVSISAAELKHGIRKRKRNHGNGNGKGNPWKRVPSDRFEKKILAMTIKIKR